MITTGENFEVPILLTCRGFDLEGLSIPAFSVRRGVLTTLVVAEPIGDRAVRLLAIFSGKLGHSALTIQTTPWLGETPEPRIIQRMLIHFSPKSWTNPTGNAWLRTRSRGSHPDFDTVLRLAEDIVSSGELSKPFYSLNYDIRRLLNLFFGAVRSSFLLYSSADFDPVMKEKARRFALSRLPACGILEITSPGACDADKDNASWQRLEVVQGGMRSRELDR